MSNRENKEQSNGWSTLATVGGMVAAFGLGAFLFSKSSETPQSHSSHGYSAPPPRPTPRPAHNAPPEECLICLDHINVRRLPCGHYFHADCIKGWESQRNRLGHIPDCPKCRQSF